MDKFRDSTEEEEAQRSDYAFTFHQWMLGNGVKDNTAKSYTRTLLLIWQDDGKAPSEMATQEYFDITKASMKNKSGNGQRSATIRKFMDFYSSNKDNIRPAPADAVMYQVKGGGTQKKNSKPDFLGDVDQDSAEASALRTNLNLPDDWKCCFRKRHSGDLVCAVSPGGTAYTTKSTVDERLGRAPGSSIPAPAVAPPAVTPAPKAPASAEPAAKKAKSASKAPVASKPVEEPAAAASVAILVTVAGEELERQEVNLETAFKRLAAGDSGWTRPRALVLSGRDPEARLTARIHGLYIEEGVYGKRPLWVKADRERQTCVCFSDARNNWRIAAGATAPGEFAKVKDKADLPWQVQKPWNVFNPSEKGFAEDPSLKTTFINPDGPLPPMVVEVCLPKLRTVEEIPPAPEAQPTPEPPAKKQKTSTKTSAAAEKPAPKAATAQKPAPKTGAGENPAPKTAAAEKPSPKIAPIDKPVPPESPKISAKPEEVKLTLPPKLNLPPAAASEPSKRSADPTLVTVEMALKKLGLDASGSQELLLISGLDDTAVNVHRIRGVYKKQEHDHGGCPVYQKADLSKGKIVLVFYDDTKNKWRITKSLEDKSDFAHVKAKAKLPWEIKKAWKVYDGNSHEESPSLLLRQLDPSSPPQGILVQLSGDSAASTEIEEEPTKPTEKRVGKGRKAGECYRNTSGVVSKKAPDDLPLEMLMALPEDPAPDHLAHVAVKWDTAHSRAHFKFAGKLIQTTLRAAGSQHSAEVIARACFVRLKDKGHTKDEVLAFRTKCYEAVSAYVPEEYKKAQGFKPKVSSMASTENADAAVADSSVVSASQDASAAEADGERSESSSSSSSSSASDAEAEATEKSSQPTDADADAAAPKSKTASRAVGPGCWIIGKAPGRMGRYASMSAVRTGLRCAQCFGGFESKCICK